MYEFRGNLIFSNDLEEHLHSHFYQHHQSLPQYRLRCASQYALIWKIQNYSAPSMKTEGMIFERVRLDDPKVITGDSGSSITLRPVHRLSPNSNMSVTGVRLKRLSSRIALARCSRTRRFDSESRCFLPGSINSHARTSAASESLTTTSKSPKAEQALNLRARLMANDHTADNWRSAIFFNSFSAPGQPSSNIARHCGVVPMSTRTSV